MQQRINISLPEDTVKLIDRVARKGNRSRLIDAAIRHYVKSAGKARLEHQLREGYHNMAKSSLDIAADWFPLDEEAWQKAGL